MRFWYNHINKGAINMESLHKKLSLEKYEKITILKKPKEVTLFDDLDFKTRLNKSQDCIITFIE